MPLPLLAGLGIAQGAMGLAQTIIGGSQSRKARRELESLPNPTTTSSASISDYYNRASVNPYESAMYKMQQQNINRGVAGGLSALQDRRSALAGVSSLVRGQNDALLRAGSQAEQQQWGRLADATRLKYSDDQRVFNINQMLPWQQKVSMLSSKAAGGNQIMNSGLQNLFGGMNSAAMGFGAIDPNQKTTY